jgi:hypothetical protein
MPRYFMHVISDGFTRDEEGVELPDLAAVREHALEGARGLVCEQIHNGYLNLDDRIEVVSDTGDAVFAISFREAFEIRT